MKIQLLKNKLLGLLIPLVLYVAWDFLTRYELVPATLMPPPRVLFDTWWDMQSSGELALNMKMSLLRVGIGFLVGASTGFLLGIAMGLWKPAEQYLSPLFNFFRQVPVVAWIPFLLLWLGIDEWFKILFISCGAVIPMTLKTYDGIRGVPASYLEVVRVFEYGRFRLLRTVILPSALPSIITGLRLSLSEAWMLVIGAELVAAGEGIGNVMVIARRLFQTDVVMVGVIVIAITGFAMDKLLGLLEARFLGWHRIQNAR
ncbi:MAG: ABC transporter permease [Desulfuromonadaceae bacterium]